METEQDPLTKIKKWNRSLSTSKYHMTLGGRGQHFSGKGGGSVYACEGGGVRWFVYETQLITLFVLRPV